METVSLNFLIKNAPTAIAMVDTKLNFINYSDQWLKHFTSNKNNIQGQPFLEVTLEMPTAFIETMKKCLGGKESVNEGEKFILPSGNVKWLKWKISPLKNNEGFSF